MYVRIYVCLYDTHTHTHTHTHTCMHTYVYTYIHTHTHMSGQEFGWFWTYGWRAGSHARTVDWKCVLARTLMAWSSWILCGLKLTENVYYHTLLRPHFSMTWGLVVGWLKSWLKMCAHARSVPPRSLSEEVMDTHTHTHTHTHTNFQSTFPREYTLMQLSQLSLASTHSQSPLRCDMWQEADREQGNKYWKNSSWNAVHVYK